MRKVLLTTTALIALGSVSAVAADVSVYGNTRYRYFAWSDDDSDPANQGYNNSSTGEILQLWTKATAETDSGLTFTAAARLGASQTDRNWMSIAGDFGTIRAGKDYLAAYTMSATECWMATIAGGYVAASSTGNSTATTDDGETRSRMDMSACGNTATPTHLMYTTPNIGGLVLKASYADAGGTSLADTTSLGAKYTVDMGGGSLAFNYTSDTVDAANEATATTEEENGEIGVSFSGGFGRAYAVNFSSKKTTNGSSTTSDQDGTEFGITYNVTDQWKAQYIRTDNTENSSASGNNRDEYGADTFGVRYHLPGDVFRVGILHKIFEYTDASGDQNAGAGSNSGSATRVELRMNF